MTRSLGVRMSTQARGEGGGVKSQRGLPHLLLNYLKFLYSYLNIHGLYRDDGLAVVNLTGVKVERLKKQVFKLFKSLDLKVTIEANITETDFLDLCLNLKD